jgi:hypothetical protein
MRIRAHLDEASVTALLAELLPVTLVFDKDEAESRWIRIDPARRVDFVAGEGLRLEVGGQLHWKTAGVPMLLTIQSAHLLLKPTVADDASGGRLVFQPSLEKMDLKSVPGFLDSGITSIVNKRLEAQGDKLAWSFGRHLAIRVPLPKELLEVETFTLTPGAATVEVLNDSLVFNLALPMGFVRRAPSPES